MNTPEDTALQLASGIAAFEAKHFSRAMQLLSGLAENDSAEAQYRLAIMYLSRIVEQGDCDAIFDKPAHPYTEALVHGIPMPDPDKRRELVSIEGEVPSLANRPSGCEFHPRCKYARERCRVERPGDQILSDGRTIQCHFPLTA